MNAYFSKITKLGVKIGKSRFVNFYLTFVSTTVVQKSKISTINRAPSREFRLKKERMV